MVEYRILGPIEVWSGERQVDVGGPKPRRLLGALLAEAGRSVPPARLVDAVWCEAPPPTARALVQTYVSQLRHALRPHGAAGAIVTTPSGYQVRPAEGTLDRDAFTRLAGAARRSAAAGRPADAVAGFDAALGLWRGPAFGGAEGRYFRGTAVHLDELRLDVLEDRFAAALAAGRLDGLPGELAPLVARYPARERLLAQLMTVLYRLGRRADALAAFRAGRAALVDELGIEPGALLAATHLAILRDETAVLGPARLPAHLHGVPAGLTAPARRPGSPVDATAPGRRPESPAGSTASARWPGFPDGSTGRGVDPGGVVAGLRAPAQLPGFPADFTGRDAELAAIVAGLSVAAVTGSGPSVADLSVADLSVADLSVADLSVADLSGVALSGAGLSGAGLSGVALGGAGLGGAGLSGVALGGAGLSGVGPSGAGPVAAVPIHVVAGAPGTGKTTLAVRAAHAVAGRFPDGQLYADLRGSGEAPADPADVLADLLRALGADPAGLPDGAPARAARLRERLAGRRLLLVLDDAHDDEQLAPLLPGAPTCAVLVTSRFRRVGPPGARRTTLGAFDPDTARRLLEHIAGADRLRAEPVAAAGIAASCGGLPLAVRLAGERLAAHPGWPVDTLAERLADEHRRLDELTAGARGVRPRLQRAYRSLDRPARRGLRRLAALGPPDAPAWVLGPLLGVPARESDAVAGRLTDAYLLDFVRRDEAGQARYGMHELTRLFGAERCRAEERPADLRAALARLRDSWAWVARRSGAEPPGAVTAQL